MDRSNATLSSPISRRQLIANSAIAGAIVAGTTLVPTSAGAQQPSASPQAEAALPSAVQETIAQSVSSAMSAAAIPGAIVYLHLPGNTPWKSAFGFADKVNQTPMTVDTHQRIGSVTKTFTATVVLQLIDEGSLTLDDTLDQFNIAVPNANTITIRNLLNMTSGLVNYTETDEYLALLVADPTGTISADELIALAAAPEIPAPSKPGEYYYCNTNYLILGKIIESITGNALADDLRSRIFTPLGMQNSGYQFDANLPAPAARGYGYSGSDEAEEATPTAAAATPDAETLFDAPPDEDGLIDLTDVNASSAGAAGAGWSTVSDLALWLPALIDGTLISPELQQERLAFVPFDSASPAGGGYGLGITDFGGLYGHDGDNFGASCIAVRDPRSGLTLIALANLYPPKAEESSSQTIVTAVFDAIGQ